MWLDADFAALVSEWMEELLTTGRVELAPTVQPVPVTLQPYLNRVMHGWRVRAQVPEGHWCIFVEGQTPLAAVWRSMIARCHSPQHKAYRFYGARGVVVCPRWRDDFLAFKADVGMQPEGMELDRFPDPCGNYEPGNVRWATRRNNQRNRRNTIKATINGVTKAAVEWLEQTGIKYGTFWKRLDLGWTPEEAVTTPIRNWKRQNP